MLNTLIVKKTNMYTSHALIYTNASVSKTFLLSPIQTNISLFKRSYPGSTPKLPKINPKLKENQASDSNIQNKFNLPTSEILQPFENESEVSKYLKTTNIPCQNQTQMENSTSQNNTAVKDNKPTIPSTNLKTLSSNDPEFQSLSSKVSNCNIEPGLHSPSTWFNSYTKENSSHNQSKNPTTSTSQSTDQSSQTNENIDNQSSNIQTSFSPETENFCKFEKEGLIEFNYQTNTKLTKEAHEINRARQPKLILKNDDTNNSFEKAPLNEDNYDSFEITQKKPFLIGTLSIDHETEVLTPQQQHLTIAKDNDENVTVFALFTSEKGTKTGISNIPTTIKVSETQVSGEKKNQYICAIIPPLNVDKADFNEKEDASNYIDNDIQNKINDLEIQANKFQPINYNGKGITMNDLEDISYIKSTTSSTNKSNNPHENKPINYNEDLD